MQYFDTLPKIIHTNNNGISTIMTNLMARVSIVPEILKSPMVYYKYDIQEGDTPEIIAHKYYDDPYRYWIVLFANRLLDPQWDWPLTSSQFNDYLNNKYDNDPVLMNGLHHYEKVITKTSRGTDDDQTIVERFIISEEEVMNITGYTNPEVFMSETKTYSLPIGYVDITITPKVVTNYEYELEVNDKKRNINILNSQYVEQLEKEFQDLMN